jgi:Zn-dependent M28 family amino/carboxypeptidase
LTLTTHNQMKRLIQFLVTVMALSGCQSLSKKNPADVITYTNIEKHIAELSADKYLGRMPMSQTEPAVIGYISEQMKEIGLEPASHGSFFQEVPILKVTSKISPFLTFTTPAGKVEIPKIADYISFSRKMEPEMTLGGSEVVFAGFGIVAPEYQRNDFAGIDVKGKTILIFVNDPGYGTEGPYFKGNTMTYYGRWTYKFEEAARQGAKACFIIHETGPAGYGWNVVSNSGETTKLYLQPADGYQSRCSFEGWISYGYAAKLFAGCGLDIAEVKKKAVSPDFKPFTLPAKASAWIRNSYSSGVSRNVCGMIRGKDRPEEAVVYTAHWDHLGVGRPVNGDSIYNGAIDNTTAVSWMLEIARAFKAGNQPERSVLFLSVTGEESGLLGSEYYTEHPLFPLPNTVACINTDGILFCGEFNDVTIIGKGLSELDGWVEKEAAKQGRYLTEEMFPEKGAFFRSDHFPFARRGVPVIYALGAKDAKKLGPEKTKEFVINQLKTIYHTPKDEYQPGRDDLSGVVKEAILMYHVGNDLANSTVFPSWNKGAEYSR